MKHAIAWLAVVTALFAACSSDGTSSPDCEDGTCDQQGEFPDGSQFDRFRGFTQNVAGIPGILPANDELHPVFAKMTEGERNGLAGWHLWAGDGSRLRLTALARKGVGDVLRILDSRDRATRFEDYGLLPDPGCKPTSKPDKFGLVIDDCEDPYASGIIGIRLKPNPKFDETAWKAIGGAEGHFSGKEFPLGDKKVPGWAVEPPYLPSLACTVCHAAPNPLRPPKDIANPQWDEIVFAIGNQYLRDTAIAGKFIPEGEFARQAALIQQPGTNDTSVLGDDGIHNPGTMNAIANLATRPRFVEKLTPGAKQPECDVLPEAARAIFCARPACPDGEGECTETYHILKEGADSSGPVGGLLRVFVNVGACTPQFFGAIKGQKPVSRQDLHDACSEYQDLEPRVPDMFSYLVFVKPYTLAGVDADALAECGAACKINKAAADRGKVVFAEQCATCHSSLQPDDPGFNVNDSATWYTAERQEFFRDMVADPAFPSNNFLSDDRRYPVTLIGTNSARAVATNAMTGKIWAEYSSETYKTLPQVKGIRKDLPGIVPGDFVLVDAPAGGPGYYRTASLFNLWNSAPFLHNNGLGLHNHRFDLAGRLEAFADAADKLLNPARRLGPASIRVTNEESEIVTPAGPIKLPAGTPIDPFVYLGGALSKGLITPADLAGSLGEIYARLPQILGPMDLVLDKGHTFGTNLSAEDKTALIEFLKSL